MNIFYLFISICVFIQLARGNKIENRRKNFAQTKLKVINDGNITRIIMSRRRSYLDLRNTTTLIYSNWSPWSRCEDCLQTRMKKCISPKCKYTRYLEEKSCSKKRCVRKTNLKASKKDLHVVRQIRDNSLMTRTMRSREWSKWSEWTPCSRKCRTHRHRICKKPGRCKKQKQVQSAYCYHEKTQCENYVLNMLDNNKSIDLSRYEYETSKQPSKAPASKKKCGRPLKKARMLKIIGGVESKKQKWPWHVAVLNRYMETFCAGTLIAPRWVLTAGHCLRSYLRVRFNEHDLTTHDGREVDMTVQRMFLHPQFNHFTVDNDIALLRLPRPVRLPVACLPSIEPVDRELCFIMGWGKQKSEDIYGTNKLHEALIPVVNTTLCKKAYRNYIITNNMFCAGWKSGFADTCAGDSGGGLMCPLRKTHRSTPYAIQGITSFGDGCGRKNKYGIYTKVYNYLKWIESTIETYS